MGVPRQAKPKHTLNDQSDLVALSPDTKTLASATIFRSVRFWDIATGKPYGELKAMPLPVTALCFSPKGGLLASACGNVVTSNRPYVPGEILVSDTLSGEVRFRLGELHSVEALAFSSNGTLLAAGVTVKVGNGLHPQVQMWELGKELILKLVLQRSAVKGEVAGVAFSHNDQLLAYASGGTVKLVDVRSGQSATELGEKLGRRLTSVAFSGDGRFLAAGGADHSIYLWDISRVGK